MEREWASRRQTEAELRMQREWEPEEPERVKSEDATQEQPPAAGWGEGWVSVWGPIVVGAVCRYLEFRSWRVLVLLLRIKR
jgi:hypothetical protein